MPRKPPIKLPTPESRRVGFAIVGLGKLSVEQLIPAVRTSQEGYVAALVTSEPDKGVEFARALGLKDSDVYTYEGFEGLADRADVEAVYIVLPNSLHGEC